ncbi:MAG: polyisoprenyl-phosphate glycosyltransferase [Eubacteriaceae bacterium]|nr:polyisoprenyl-phosphate glycosyltransferase [Eubacteriaceae bacterium]MDK2904243.1 polyisoprenyl-phosphate glycosyltransferase [Eubacteriaceae bacterium]MDK2935727.1 polyisoprenyl-phosphate glycosyltransferase [Eubacteriaceae bacterium]
MKTHTVYSIVVPLYNEELVIDEMYKRITAIMDQTGETYELVWVNDGSKDATREMAEALCRKDSRIELINFSRNFGHQQAITAGMEAAKGDAIVVIDADLQDPPELILSMIEKWKEGYDVVYAKRSKREGESFFKKLTAKTFYRFLDHLTSVEIPKDTGDFRLIDRKVCDALNALPEKNRYVRGLISWLGFKQTAVEFVRQERFDGETKYTLKKMIKLAFDGITSFSFKPITCFTLIGGVILTAGLIAFLADGISIGLGFIEFSGITMIAIMMMILFGITYTAFGIMGQYISRILDESRKRPNYVIDEKIHCEAQTYTLSEQLNKKTAI